MRKAKAQQTASLNTRQARALAVRILALNGEEQGWVDDMVSYLESMKIANLPPNVVRLHKIK